MNSIAVEEETWHDVRSNLLSLESALERWACRDDYTVAERTHSGFMSRGVGQAVTYWHVVTEDLTSNVSMREQLTRMILADADSGDYNPSMCAGLRLAARTVCAVYGQ